MTDMQPLYAQVKAHITRHINSAHWGAGTRVPSENELAAQFSISRMTANRALRELAGEGYLTRVPGVGSFVREKPARTSFVELRNIADEVTARGHRYSARCLVQQQITASPTLLQEFAWQSPKPLYHLMMIHAENGLAVQLEERWINPAFAPDFMSHDFLAETPTAYLLRTVPVSELEHGIEAVLPDAQAQKLLGVKPQEPCLALHRRSWSGQQIVTVANLLYPASRYSLYSRYKTSSTGKLT